MKGLETGKVVMLWVGPWLCCGSAQEGVGAPDFWTGFLVLQAEADDHGTTFLSS